MDRVERCKDLYIFKIILNSINCKTTIIIDGKTDEILKSEVEKAINS